MKFSSSYFLVGAAGGAGAAGVILVTEYFRWITSNFMFRTALVRASSFEKYTYYWIKRKHAILVYHEGVELDLEVTLV